MSIQDLGALGELVGSIAVVITLIYLAFQLRQNTQALKLNAEFAAAQEHVQNLIGVSGASVPYIMVLLMAAVAYLMLQQTIIASTFWVQWFAQALFILVALLWLVPDRRMEHALQRREV